MIQSTAWKPTPEGKQTTNELEYSSKIKENKSKLNEDYESGNVRSTQMTNLILSVDNGTLKSNGNYSLNHNIKSLT